MEPKLIFDIANSFFNEKYSLSGCFALLAIAMICIYFKEYIAKKAIALSLIILFSLTSLYFLIFPPTPKPHFRVTSSGYILPIMNNDENSYALFNMLSPDSNSVTRIPVFAYLTITNVQSTPIIVTSMRAEASRDANGPWTKLCRVDLRKGQLVTKMGEAVFKIKLEDNYLDNVLPEKNIPAGESVAGWSAWGCKTMRECSFPFSHMRITFGENGENSNATAPLNSGNNMTSSMYKPIEMINLTNRKPEFDNRCD